ncbi:hypothetical protein BKA83DRAFT_4466263 [Pisolithus microcarpus]|nr:hypothetical protein BKA83DRAFT_4466263 [Pisolithus microcarpus]
MRPTSSPVHEEQDVPAYFDDGLDHARPCNENGEFLLPGAPPLPPSIKTNDDWSPYYNHLEFETTELLFQRCEMSARQTDTLLDLWAASLLRYCDQPPFSDHKHLYKTIDSTPLGGVKWECFKINHLGEKPEVNAPPWMDQDFDVWFRDPCLVIHNILGNPAFKDELDLQPFREYSAENDERCFQDFMSGDWAWDQVDIIGRDPETYGSMFVPIILGSDKTTVSVAMGNHEYYPMYMSIGNVRNSVRRAHGDALVLIAFLATPKTTKEHASDPTFRKFRCQLFHTSISTIFTSLKPAMTKPEVVRFGDGFYRRTIYSLGPYIADYEEQALLMCIVRCWCPRCLAHRSNLDVDALCCCKEFTEALFEERTLAEIWDEYGIVGDIVPFTNNFPRADIHKLISPDLLHQLIKGIFKDHLVDWVEKYLRITHSKREAEQIMDDIDRHIAAIASFSGLRRFPQGHGFKQWTGDDSKALMKVYIATIEGHVPRDIVCTFRTFLEFCYIAHCNVITESALKELNDALQRFYHYREFFKMVEVATTFSLPRQHSMKHYVELIRQFGAPNGLCSSMTENKHIRAVKKPYRRLETLITRGVSREDGDEDEAELPRSASIVGDNDLAEADDGPTSLSAHLELARTPLIPLAQLPRYDGQVRVFNSASSRFYAPSDLSGVGGMRTEYIRACPMWRNEGPRNDCIFVGTDPEANGMRAYSVARILAFFSFNYKGVTYPCAAVRWFDTIGNEPDNDMGMWMVRPTHSANNSPFFNVIHLDTIYRAAHLIPIYGTRFISPDIKSSNSYDAFRAFYVNKYADHHAFKTAT